MNMSSAKQVYQFGVVCYFCLNAELLLLLSPASLVAAAMATVNWSFGPEGFSVRVTNEQGATSVVSGAAAMDEMAIKLTPLTTDASAISVERAVAQMPSMNDWGPLPRGREQKIVTRVPMMIEIKGEGADCETSVSAMWTVTSTTISGKGTGKGMGKSIRIEPLAD